MSVQLIMVCNDVDGIDAVVRLDVIGELGGSMVRETGTELWPQCTEFGGEQ